MFLWFLKWRIERLKIKVEAQKAAVSFLVDKEHVYKNSYYTDRLIKEHRGFVELNSKLKYLERKLKNKQGDV